MMHLELFPKSGDPLSGQIYFIFGDDSETMREDLPVLDKERKDKQQYQPANRYQIQMYCCCPGKDLCSITDFRYLHCA